MMFVMVYSCECKWDHECGCRYRCVSSCCLSGRKIHDAGKRHIMCLVEKSVNTQPVNTVSNLDKLGVSYAYAFSDRKSAEEQILLI